MEEQTQQPTIQTRKKKRNYWKIAFIITTIVLLFWGGYVIFKNFEQVTYNQGVDDGVWNLIVTQAQQEIYYYLSNHTGNITIEVKSLQEICGGGQ